MQKESNHYIADEGKLFQRKSDGLVMGRELWLLKTPTGTKDRISNYEEIDDPDYVKETDPEAETEQENEQEGGDNE